MHPVGLYLLGSLLKKNSWNVNYINCLTRDSDLKNRRYKTGTFESKIIEKPVIFKNVDRHYRQYGLSEKSFLASLKNIEKPDMIFITSGMTYWIDGLINTYKIIEKIFPNVQIVIGGISANLIPKKLQELFPKAIIFSDQIFNNDTLTFTKNINIKNLNQPLSIKEIFPSISEMRHGPVLTTLGCPYRCSYCASKIIQKKFHIRSTEVVFSEIKEMINKYEIIDFSFYDDALLYKPANNFIPLAKKILSLNKELRFHAPNGLHLKWLDKNIVNLMKEIGFRTLRFGYESGATKYKNDTNSKTEKNEIKEKVEIMLNAGFPPKDIGIYVMGGLPEQTPEIMFDDIKFINSLGVKAKPVFISPVPKTPIFEYYKTKFPILEKDPRVQNDIFFISQLDDWGFEKLNSIKNKILELNRSTEKINH